MARGGSQWWTLPEHMRASSLKSTGLLSLMTKRERNDGLAKAGQRLPPVIIAMNSSLALTYRLVTANHAWQNASERVISSYLGRSDHLCVIHVRHSPIAQSRHVGACLWMRVRKRQTKCKGNIVALWRCGVFVDGLSTYVCACVCRIR